MKMSHFSDVGRVVESFWSLNLTWLCNITTLSHSVSHRLLGGNPNRPLRENPRSLLRFLSASLPKKLWGGLWKRTQCLKSQHVDLLWSLDDLLLYNQLIVCNIKLSVLLPVRFFLFLLLNVMLPLYSCISFFCHIVLYFWFKNNITSCVLLSIVLDIFHFIPYISIPFVFIVELFQYMSHFVSTWVGGLLGCFVFWLFWIMQSCVYVLSVDTVAKLTYKVAAASFCSPTNNIWQLLFLPIQANP